MTAYEDGPWVGLRPFGRQDYARFFGRDAEKRAVAELWTRHRLTLLVGDSGVGKTSLLHAGAAPYAVASGAQVVPVGDLSYRRSLPAPLITARGRPLFALLSSWQPAEDPTRSIGLTIQEFFKRKLGKAGRGTPLLVAIDGAERMLRRPTAAEPEHRRLRAELEAALRAFPDVHLLLAIRPDAVEAALDLCVALNETPARYDLSPLDRPSAIDALTRPLLGTPLQFDHQVAERLVDVLKVEHGTPGGPRVEPVLLQMLCAELLAGLHGGRTLSAAAKRVLDDVDATLADFCTRTLYTLTSDHGLPTCEIGGWMRRTFTRSPDEASPHEAVPAPRSARPKEVTDAVVRAVEDRHLLKYCRLPDEDGLQLQHPLLARALQRLGESPVAQPEPTADDLLRETEEAMTAGNPKLAEKYARAALATAGKARSDAHVSARITLGDVAYMLGDHGAACQAYEKALEIELLVDAGSPTVTYLYAAIARLHLLQGDMERALGVARASRVNQTAELIARLEVAQSFWRTNRHQAAVKELNVILERDPTHCEALRIRGEIYADWGKSQQAVRDLSSVAISAPPSARAAYILAANVPVTRGEIEELREEGRSHGLVLLYLAQTTHRNGNRDLAAELAEEALLARNPCLSSHHRRQAAKIIRKQ
ncbi:tetratricopeptide repeat protein [Nonomuraea coxensis]|nr:ATP-binding protein [Nonomuraea coxensis]